MPDDLHAILTTRFPALGGNIWSLGGIPLKVNRLSAHSRREIREIAISRLKMELSLLATENWGVMNVDAEVILNTSPLGRALQDPPLIDTVPTQFDGVVNYYDGAEGRD